MPASQGGSCSHCSADLLKQVGESPAKTQVLELAAGNLLLNPVVCLGRRTTPRAVAPLSPYHESTPPPRFGCSGRNHKRFIRLKNSQNRVGRETGRNVGN